jgi:hypothetical protein
MISRSTLTGPLAWSVLSLAACLVLVLAGAGQIVGAAFASGAGDEKPSEFLARLEQAHTRAVETDRDRIDGRNLFYPTRPRPKAPPPRTEPQTPRETAPPPPPPPSGPPPPPASYQGPGMVAVVGDAVWFNPVRSDGRLLVVRMGEAKEGVSVISTNPPWSARLGYSGGEYDVDLLQRTLPGLVSAADIEATPPGLIPVSSPGGDAPPAVEPETDADEQAAEDGVEVSDDEAPVAGEPETADEREIDPDTGRPRPADPTPTPARPDTRSTGVAPSR